MRATQKGLSSDMMILAPTFTPPPMRCPDGMWAMLVTAVDIIGEADPDRTGEVALFAAQWVGDQPPADDLYDGDLVVRLIHPTDPTYLSLAITQQMSNCCWPTRATGGESASGSASTTAGRSSSGRLPPP